MANVTMVQENTPQVDWISRLYCGRSSCAFMFSSPRTRSPGLFRHLRIGALERRCSDEDHTVLAHFAEAGRHLRVIRTPCPGILS
jgi:hypothetical protein